MKHATYLALAVVVLTGTLFGDDAMKILSAAKESATVQIPADVQIPKDTCFEVRKGDSLLGFLQAIGVQGTGAECKVIAGRADAAASAVPILPCAKRIALITDDPKHKAVEELNVLYPGLVTTDPAEQSKCDTLVCLIFDPEKAKTFDLSSVQAFAASGKTAIVSLDAYAPSVAAKTETVQQKKHLEITIERVTDLTRGMAVGQKLNWYGTEGEGDDPKKKDKFHTTITGLPESKRLKVIARSAANGCPIFVEESVGKGRIIAMDLISPNGSAGYDAGSKNKWVFPGNVLGRSVWRSPYRTKKLPYDEYVGLMRAIVAKHEGRIKMEEIGKGSDDDPIYGLRLGNASAPSFLIIGSIHGGEWKNSYALLDLIETLLENPDKDYKIDWLLRSFDLRFVPLLNAAGYRKYGQVNKNDCDLNRNYPFHWDTYKGDGGWRAKYPPLVLKGKAPFSEAESQIVKRLVEEKKPIGLIDMHMHGFKSGHMICCPHKEACADLKELQAVKLLIDACLRNRYLFGSDKQLQLRGGGYGSDRPFLINWSGTLGIRSTVFESVGGWEDSLIHGDVVLEDCLNFMYVVGANYLARESR